jgi:excinuclease ABC subunit A
VDRPWRELSKKDREWILFTDEQPVVPVYAGYTLAEVRRALKRKEEPSYQGTFTSARRHVLHSFANTQSAMMKQRALQYMLSTGCRGCHGKRLRPESLSVKFAGLDIADMSSLPLKQLISIFNDYAKGEGTGLKKNAVEHPEKVQVIQRIAQDLMSRLAVILELGLGYLSLDRSTPTLSPGELQRLRLATQVHSNLFGVVYVLDEPSAGLHPIDTQALLNAFKRLQNSGNSLFIVEHDLDVIRHADWIVDVGPGAGEQGGHVLYSGPLAGLEEIKISQTGHFLFGRNAIWNRVPRSPVGWLKLRDVTRNNLNRLQVEFPLGVFTTITGVSGSGKSSLVSQVLVELVAKFLGQKIEADTPDEGILEEASPTTTGGQIISGMEHIKRLVPVDQKAIGRTPRSNLATYTGLFDQVRSIFAATDVARIRHYDAGRFSFNVAKGRCQTCKGEGFVMVELLFLPSVYSPCPTCHGTRYNPKTLEIKYRGKNIAEVLAMTVNAARDFFDDQHHARYSLSVLQEVGLGYLRLGQPATELSGGEAQRIKLATELQRVGRGKTLYILDESTTGLHASDIEKLMAQLNGLVESGNTVIVVEHDMRVAAGSDWIIDIGPGAGDEGGHVVAAGVPQEVVHSTKSHTAPYLKFVLGSSNPIQRYE